MRTIILVLMLMLGTAAQALEYKVSIRRLLAITEAAQERYLNEMAAEGWELVLVVQDSSNNYVFYFKR
jgi:hypothetical protein